MPSSENGPGTREDEKRKKIRKYFAHQPSPVAPIALLVAGVALWKLLDEQSFGTLLAVAGVVWLAVQLLLRYITPSDETIDSWFQEDLRRLESRSLDRLNLDASQLIRESLVITGPILWDVYGVPKEERAWKKGKDNRARFSVNGVTVIHLTEHKLSSYQCDFNSIRGAALNEHDDEYYYNDIVAVSTRDSTTNYTLPNNQIMKHAQSFTLSVSSGEMISVVINSRDLLDLTGAEFMDTGVDSSIKAIRKVLGERKIR